MKCKLNVNHNDKAHSLCATSLSCRDEICTSYRYRYSDMQHFLIKLPNGTVVTLQIVKKLVLIF